MVNRLKKFMENYCETIEYDINPNGTINHFVFETTLAKLITKDGVTCRELVIIINENKKNMKLIHYIYSEDENVLRIKTKDIEFHIKISALEVINFHTKGIDIAYPILYWLRISPNETINIYRIWSKYGRIERSMYNELRYEDVKVFPNIIENLCKQNSYKIL